MKQQIVPTAAILFLLLVLGWYLDSIAHPEISNAVKLIISTFVLIIIAVLVLLLIFTVLIMRERVLKERARRKIIERDAKVMYVTANEGQQVYIRDVDKTVTWRNAHLDGRVYASGQQAMLSHIELAAWQTYMLRHRPTAANEIIPQILPARAQTDLLYALDSVQRCLIVGASDSGKTTLLQWLVNRRLQTSKVVVIDPHAYPEKWQGCIVVGTGRNYHEIGQALDGLVRLMTKRYEEIGKGLVAEQAHSRITILVDEWRAIVYNVKSASEAIKALLTESRKAAFSIFVATHSDRAKPLGLEGEYDLKDGFAIVRLSIINGLRQATIDAGNGEVPVVLPGPFAISGLQAVVTRDYISLEAEPSAVEAHVLKLYEEGKTISFIAGSVFGAKGGNQNQRVKEILSKYRAV